MRWRLLVLLSVLSFFISCRKSETCSYDSCALVAPASEITQLEAYLNSNSITAVKHCSGLYYQLLTDGTGAAPSSCSVVSVTYKGSLTNGNVFEKVTTPVVFDLTTLITGWKNGLPKIKKGGKIKLFIPPSLGYGATASASIPANSILIFDIDLLDVK